MIRYSKSRVRIGLTLISLALFLVGFLWIPLEHRISLCASEQAELCCLAHGAEDSHESPVEEHDSDTCPICVLAAEYVDSVTPLIAVVEVDVPAITVLPFVHVHVAQAATHCFLARAPPVA